MKKELINVHLIQIAAKKATIGDIVAETMYVLKENESGKLEQHLIVK